MTINNAVNAGSNGIQILNNTTGVYSGQPLSAKGDLLSHTGSAYATQTVGSNGQVLTADSTQTNGIKWAASAGGVPSVSDFLGSLLLVDDFVGVQQDLTTSPTKFFSNLCWSFNTSAFKTNLSTGQKHNSHP